MLANALERFSDTIYMFLSGQKTSAKGLLVKKHFENLQTHGEFSFPDSSKSWAEHIEKLSASSEDESLLRAIGKTSEDIVVESSKWNLQVNSVRVEKGRVYLFIVRPSAISLGLAAGIQNAALITQKLQKKINVVRIDPLCVKPECLTYLRVKYLSKVIENLCSILLDEEQTQEVFVTSKSSSTCTGTKVLCSTVLSAKTSKKETDVNAVDFIRSRQDDMTRIAQHKYGVRVTTDSKWREFIEHLGESAAAFELLQIKPTSVVKVNCDFMSGGISKGTILILRQIFQCSDT